MPVNKRKRGHFQMESGLAYFFETKRDASLHEATRKLREHIPRSLVLIHRAHLTEKKLWDYLSPNVTNCLKIVFIRARANKKFAVRRHGSKA